MSKIKVLTVITGLTTGGAEMMLFKTVTLMDREKYEPIVVSLTPKEVVSTWLEAEGIPVYSINMGRGVKHFLSGVRKFHHIVKKCNPSIIHAHLFHADFLSRLVGTFNKVPIIISTIHSEDIGGRKREMLLRVTDPFTNCVTTVCQTVATKFIHANVIKKEKTEVIYNGIDIATFTMDKNERKIAKSFSDEIRIISVGRLHREKNFSMLIETVEELIETYPMLKCLIAGDGEEEEKLHRLVKEKALEDHIFLLGRRSDVFQLLDSSDLFVLPSICEGMSVAILEAMAAYTPVIATDVGGTAEILQNDTGILIPAQDQQQLKMAIIRAIEMDEIERNAMVKKARERVEKEFAIKETVKKNESVYDRLLVEKGLLKGEYDRTVKTFTGNGRE